MEHTCTPLVEALKNYVTERVIRFHTPGHRGGSGVGKEFRNLLGLSAWELDVTQVPGLDDIHSPTGVCGHAQELMAKAYGSKRAFFLVNGSSCGNHAMLLAALKPGDKVLLPRNVHRSALAGLVLSGGEPVYYVPEFDPSMGVFHGPTLVALQRAYAEAGKVKALFLVSPTYYGAVPDLGSIISWASSLDLLVLVDEAWGAHLNFHPELPASALAVGADLVVHSVHKLLPGLTQGAVLHLNSLKIDGRYLHNVLTLLQSTSPSYLLLASLDAARCQMVESGREMISFLLAESERLRNAVNDIDGIRCHGGNEPCPPGVESWDVTRLVITAVDLGLSGYELSRLLRCEYRIQVELADRKNILLLLTPGYNRREGDRLLTALRSISQSREGKKRTVVPDTVPPVFLPPVMSVREAFLASSRFVSWQDAIGKISAGWVTVYPPGVPVIGPGEVVTEEMVAYLRSEKELGAEIDGISPFGGGLIRVVDRNG